jgi:hypothetical protein
MTGHAATQAINAVEVKFDRLSKTDGWRDASGQSAPLLRLKFPLMPLWHASYAALDAQPDQAGPGIGELIN